MAIEGRNDGAQRRVRLGMVGGGEGAFIGAVHRIAARLDDHYELLAGALSSQPERAKRSGAALGLDPGRSYGGFEEMAHAEAKHPNGIEAVAIVTPNHMHAPVATAFLKAGIHVICDKPLTATLAEAKALADLVRKSNLVFAVTYNYTGYPMVRQARAMVADGTLGTIRVIQVEYPQDWLTERIEPRGISRQNGAPIPSAPAPAAALAISALMPSISPASSVGWTWTACWPISPPSCRDAR